MLASFSVCHFCKSWLGSLGTELEENLSDGHHIVFKKKKNPHLLRLVVLVSLSSLFPWVLSGRCLSHSHKSATILKTSIELPASLIRASLGLH
jgi:hypothetical protein